MLQDMDRLRTLPNGYAVETKFTEAHNKLSIAQLDKEWKDFWTEASPVLRAIRNNQAPFTSVSKGVKKWLNEFNDERKRLNATEVTWSESYSRRCRDHVEYLIANIGPDLPRFECDGVPTASFEKPVHRYDAIEVTANKRFSSHWGLIASYRYSRLKGNFEGFFRSDNGQSDPSITSLFDFPTNDPSYTSIGTPEFGYQGDIRYQGNTLGEGALPNDRPHQVKVYGSYGVGDLNLGLGFNASSGRPLTALAANPSYGAPGEIPVTLRGGGIATVDGFRTRTPFEYLVDLHADYTIRLGREQRIVLVADAFNLLNRQAATNYDTYVDQGFGSTNPNFGYPTNGGGSLAAGYVAPRRVRLGARFEW